MADYLLANTDHLVFGMVRRTSKPDYGNLTTALTNPRFKLVVGDLTDPHSIDELVAEIKPDYFINFGAQAFVGDSWRLKEMTQQTNSNGVQHCLEAIRKHVPHCRFYNAGTSEEFGKVEYVPQDEKHPARPQSPYGASKVAARQHVRIFRESYGLYAIQGWLFNHESERRGASYVTRKITLGVARIAAAMKAGQSFEPIELGNIEAKRDWSHAEDFVDGIWRMLNQREIRNDPLVRVWTASMPGGLAPLQEYVLSSNETHTVREFIEKAFSAAGIPGVWWNCGGYDDPKDEVYLLADRERPTLATKLAVPLVRINPAFYRAAEVDLLHGDSTRARTELGWQPKVSFDELVTRMVRADLAAQGIHA